MPSQARHYDRLCPCLARYNSHFSSMYAPRLLMTFSPRSSGTTAKKKKTGPGITMSTKAHKTEYCTLLEFPVPELFRFRMSITETGFCRVHVAIKLVRNIPFRTECVLWNEMHSPSCTYNSNVVNPVQTLASPWQLQGSHSGLRSPEKILLDGTCSMMIAWGGGREPQITP